MMMTLFHKLFHVPYSLKITQDTKQGLPVIFLHGVASDSSTWKHVLPKLPPHYRAITIDLLGFGSSPKPRHISYTMQDHARAVTKTIRRLGMNKPAVIVGHSMGALIAIDIAENNPQLVHSLVLVGAPLYNPEDIVFATSKYANPKLSLGNSLFYMYDQIVYNKKLTLKTAQRFVKIAPFRNSFILTKDTWEPFKLSLTNTIMKQNSTAELLGLHSKVVLVYGKMDLLLQQKNYDKLASFHNENIILMPHRGAHMITKQSAPLVIQAIEEAAK